MDYSLYTANIKRKRQTPTPRKVQVRKSGPMLGGDSDEEGDEEWAGGMRNIDFSSGRRQSLRSSRQ